MISDEEVQAVVVRARLEHGCWGDFPKGERIRLRLCECRASGYICVTGNWIMIGRFRPDGLRVDTCYYCGTKVDLLGGVFIL